MNKALRSILSVCMALALVGCGVGGISPAEGVSAPAINILDQYVIPFHGYDDLTVKTFRRNGDYWISSVGYHEGTVEIHTELNGRC
jgi:hypothetical protein